MSFHGFMSGLPYTMILVMVFVPAQFANDKIIVYNYLRESGWLRPHPVLSTKGGRRDGGGGLMIYGPRRQLYCSLSMRDYALLHSSRTESMEAEMSAYLRSAVDPPRWTGQAQTGRIPRPSAEKLASHSDITPQTRGLQEWDL